MIPIRLVMHEEELREVFIKHPYLITKENDVINIVHENNLNSESFPDLLIETPNTKYYCGIKLRELRKKDYHQTKRYHNAIINNKLEFSKKDVSIMLIGKSISNSLRKKAELHSIHIVIIGIDTPERINICESCRKAYSSNFEYCTNCNSNQVLGTIKLKYP